MGPGLPAAPEGQQGETESDASEGGGLGCVGGSADGDVVDGCVFDPATVNDEGDAGDGRSGDGSEEAEGVRCLREGEAADESTGGVIDGNDRGAELVGKDIEAESGEGGGAGQLDAEVLVTVGVKRFSGGLEGVTDVSWV